MKLLVAAFITALSSCRAGAQVVTTDDRSLLWVTHDATCSDVETLFRESFERMEKVKKGEGSTADWQLSQDGLAFSAVVSYIAGYAASVQTTGDTIVSYFDKVCTDHPGWKFDYAMRKAGTP